jgi:hypothetical protein
LTEHACDRAPVGKIAASLALFGAVLGMAFVVVPLCQYTCALVLWEDSPRLIQSLPSDGQPLPAQLAWSPWLFRIISRIGGMPLAGALGIYIALVACAGYAAVRALNASFRVTTGVDWDRFLLFRTYMHTAPLIKVIVTSVPAFVVSFAVWSLVRLAAPSGWLQPVLAGVVFGAAAWLTLSRDGVIGDCDSGNYQLPRGRDAISMAVRGAAFGVAVWIVLTSASEASPERLLRLAGSIGGLGQPLWWWVAMASLAAGALAGGVLGFTLGLLSKPFPCEGSASVRLGLCAVSVAAFASALTVWLPAHVRSAYDADLRTGLSVQPTWWRPENPSDRTETLIAMPTRTSTDSNGTSSAWRVQRVAHAGVSGIALRGAPMEELEKFMRRRDSRTALRRSGTMALYDRACLDLDLGKRLNIAGTCVRESGDPQFARLLMEDIGLLAGLPEAAAALTAFSDPALFVYPTDDAHVPVGDLYARQGRFDEARQWYAKAGLPPLRAGERASRVGAVHKGTVTGRVIVKANVTALPQAQRPVLQVALIPAYGMLAASAASAQPRAAISPFELREVVRSAKADAGGRFRIEYVGPGNYKLMVWMLRQRGSASTLPTVRSEPRAAATMVSDGATDHYLGVITVGP